MQIRFPGMTCVVCGQPLPPGSEAEVHPNLKGPQGGKKYYHAEHGAQRNPSRAASRRAKARASGRRKRGGERFQGETESFQTKKEIIDSILGGEEGIGWTTSKEKRERRRNLQWYGKEDLMEQFFGVPRGPRSRRNPNGLNEDYPGKGFTPLVGPLAEMAEGNAYILSESFDWYKLVGDENDRFEAAVIGWSYPTGRAKTGTYAVGVFNDEAARYSTKYKNIKELRHATALAKELSAYLQQHAHPRGKDLQEARNLYGQR
jgi:hypothetical protein